MKTILLAILAAACSHASTMWVLNYTSTVYEYNGATGAPVGTFTAPGAVNSIAQYDGDVYLLNGTNNDVYEYSASGAYIGTVVNSFSSIPYDGAQMTFGPNGDMYITLTNSDEVMIFTAGGSYVGTLTGAGNAPDGLTFDASGNLYVASFQGQQILEYADATGTPTVYANVGGQPDSLAFGPNGDLYATNVGLGVYNVTAGTDFATVPPTARGLVFESNGELYVASQDGNAIYQVNGTTGGTATLFASGEGLTNALQFAFVDSSAAAPEPSTFLLLGTALIALGAWRKNR